MIAVAVKDGTMVRYVQNLIIAYLKNLPNRTTVTHQKKIFACLPYLRTFHWMVCSKRTVLKRYGTCRSIKALNISYLKGTVRR